MACATMLFASSDTSLIQVIREAIVSVKDCRIETFNEVGNLIPQVERDDVALALVHLVRGADDSSVTRLLQEIVAVQRPVPLLVISDRECPDQALRLLRLGAADYLIRPLDLSRLAFLVDMLTLRTRSGEVLHASGRRSFTVQSLGDRFPFLYVSAEMHQLVGQVRQIAPQDTTILLSGETGTGKTRLAGLIHELSPRRDKPLLVVSFAALSETIIESELFGHVKGAFTGADHDRTGKLIEARDGTLLLDDIDTLPLRTQGKLLQAIDERLVEPVGSNRSLAIQARLIAASNRSLEDEVAAGRFRADLYYRINVVSFHLPPLRKQRLIIRPLVEKFISEFAARLGRRVLGLSADAADALEAYDWPGNIRELSHAIERAVALCSGPQIEVADLPQAIRAAGSLAHPSNAAADSPNVSVLSRSRIQAEIGRIMEALRKHGDNRVKAAMELGISRVTLYRKLHRYGLM